MRYPGIPNLLDNIFRGATIYFVVICTCQLLVIFISFLAPVSHTWCQREDGVDITVHPLLALVNYRAFDVGPPSPSL